MGGSGLIVVVIVAAWALFLVPQWMHKRASAAAHLADRIPSTDGAEADLDGSEPVAEADPGDGRARKSRRFGRRNIARTHADDDAAPLWSRWHLPTMPSVRRRASGRSRGEPAPSEAGAPVSAAARRRRILTLLALATLVTAVVVGVAALFGAPVPTWVVAVPGGLMLAYLALLAVVRPGAPSRRAAEPVEAADVETGADPADVAVAERVMAPSLTARPEAEPAPAASSAPANAAVEPALEVNSASQPSAQDDSWTPVPLPTPTYVTAPRARRSVRTIDLSNPGSWTTPAPVTSSAAPPQDEAEERDDYLVEHRRAVGD